ncbi:methyltransferase [Halosimplex salinum]|uniref:methyltransferase n=1 Tax=Halosimplex salinum TaxID=1710538 RepID=UPI000F4AC96E|nr:methyltransferase [Halosimplex salinum]
MPVQPNVVERLAIYRFDRAPSAIVDVLDAGSFYAVALAHDLDVFATLDRPRSVGELAAEIDADPAALGDLLRVLAANGYVERDGGAFVRAATTERWLTDDGAANLAPWFTFWRDVVFPFWNEYLETAVREGGPPLTLYEWLNDDPDLWPTAQRGFRAVATLLADPVVDEVDLPGGATTLLDLGGGHGRYAVELCERNPGLSAVVFDHPDALAVAETEIGDRGLADRMETRGGDYRTDDIGEGYDAVLLFNVLHGHDEAEVRALFERVHDALAPGGRVVVLDQFRGGGRMNVGRAAVALVSLTYRATLGRGVHDADAVADWLRAAGFGAVERTGLRRDPGSELLQATRE